MTASSSNQSDETATPRVERFRFELPGRLEFRDAARSFLAHICDHLAREGSLPADAGHRVISAFVEAFNNAVIHAYEGAKVPGAVEVELELGADALLVRIIDHGQAFVPEEVPEPDLSTLPEGGLGLFIIRSFMDEVSYARENERNIITMVKQFEAGLTEPELDSARAARDRRQEG